MYIDKSNEVLMNHYRKKEIIKANERIKEGMPIIKVLQLADKEFITTDELMEALCVSKEQVLDEFLNTPSVSNDTPMVLAKKYMEYFELYNHDRKKICKDKKIANGTFQKYLRLNYLIPELQELVDNKKLGIVSAEHISYLYKNIQENICYLIKKFRCEITTGVAKKIKEEFILCQKTGKIFNLNESVIRKYGKEKNLKVVFNEYEVDRYFAGIHKKQIKEHILKALNSSYKNQL